MRTTEKLRVDDDMVKDRGKDKEGHSPIRRKWEGR